VFARLPQVLFHWRQPERYSRCRTKSPGHSSKSLDRRSIKTRSGKTAMIDATKAAQEQRSAIFVIGKAFSGQGTYDVNGKLLATIIIRAKPSAGSWPPDR
jgi:hypothetical protein